MSSTLKHLRIHCNRWLIYSNELEFAFYLSHKNHCYCWADRWSVLNRLQFIRRKEEHYTPHIWRTCLALFLQLQKLFSFYFFQWDSLSLSLSFFFFFAVFLPHYCFGLCLKSTEILIWMPEVSILHIPLTTKVFFLYFFSKRVQSQLLT